jgi:flagellar basal-body rod modification protein FlgD
MAAIAEASAALASNGTTASKASATSAQSGEDRFLTLLVAQMKNQDPLNPLDNAQVTSQLAQISTVSGVEKLNATLQALTAAFTESQSLQAAALIGRDVLVQGDSLALAHGVARGGFELAEAADQVTLTIADGSGNLVYRADLGAQVAGVHTIAWDGLNAAGVALADGTYRVSASATRSGAAVAVDTLSAARVLGVARDAAGTSLELSGAGWRRYADVKQII